jgi:hypothetical protein
VLLLLSCAHSPIRASFLIWPEKEFKDGHQGDLAGAGSLMQSKVNVYP